MLPLYFLFAIALLGRLNKSKEQDDEEAQVIENDYEDTKNNLNDEGHPDFIIPVSVHVTDVNDNTPQFVGRSPYRLNISELTLVSFS